MAQISDLELCVASMTQADPTGDESFAKKVHQDGTNLCAEIIGYFFREKVTVNESIFVPLTIFSRVIRLRDAIMILTKAGYPTEAAIILLSQFEAKLDLAQAASDVKWATGWVEHQDTKKSVTQNITAAIGNIFENDQKDNELSIFRYLSMLKHGNPASSELGFQVRRDNKAFSVSTGKIEDKITKFAGTMMDKYATYQLAWAAQALNVTIQKYAVCDQNSVNAVRENWLKVKGFEKEFASFLSSLVEGRNGHLGLPSAFGR